MSHKIRLALLLCACFSCLHAQAQEGSFTTRSLTPETALQAARTALESCRKQGFQVAVAVVDRGGITQVLLRDRYAGPHTVEVAASKAWTALSFRTASSTLAQETQAGRPMSGMRNQPRVIAAGGGLPVEGGGSLLGGIGVSGAPSGELDDACAQAGLKAVADLIEF
ncbi:GlcG/HbpS family heme-binding protein [Paucibacter soli]|uniref:GlcG/HbpS family heme-binding protein n=1 Tax=Paucibacter soli TaxID=3133433 RepID=UPI0030AD4391